jgi:DNA-binding beta-propeller fold protein YncE
VDDRRFDQLSRRIAALALPRLPRRALAPVLGVPLAGALGLLADPDDAFGQKNKGNNKNKNNDASAEKKNKKCKKEGKKCDKKKCKKQDKKCCCKNLKCKNDVCEGQGSQCPTDASLNDEFGDSGSGNGEFNDPFGIAIDEDGFLYVTDTGNTRVQIFDQNGGFEDEFGTQGNGQEQFQTPLGIGVNENSGGDLRIIVADPDMNDLSRRLRRFNENGGLISEIGRNALTEPTGVGIDADGNIWVVDNVGDGEVFLYDEDGVFEASWTPSGNGELDNPQGIAVFEDDDDNATYVYIADTGNNRVVKFEYVDNSADGLEFVDDAGSSGSGNSNFNQPTGIAVDECGNVWVADRINNRIQQLDKNLNFESRFSSSLDRPTGVAINPNGNRLYVVNNNGNSVSIFDLDD